MAPYPEPRHGVSSTLPLVGRVTVRLVRALHRAADMRAHNNNTLPLQVLTFCLLWSSAFAAAKLTLAYCPPFLLLSCRFLLAGLVMLAALAMQRGDWRMRRRDLLVFALL